ncbi:MAG: DUF2662 domain-containing protein [Acidobacteria bacterium]|nr:MAG: DUF2662 domain-containing protein [Acidobacteriota bacterium]
MSGVGLKSFERRLERMVEGAFSRIFRSGLRPVELGRKLTREMDDRRSVGVGGRAVVPNDFTFWLSEADHSQLAEIEGALRRELADAARDYARDEGYTFMGPVEVEMVVDENLRPGAFRVLGKMKEGEGGTGAGSIILPSNERVPLGDYVVTVGRQPDSTIVLADPNVSRRHAEVRPQGDGYVVVDLGSTNGTRVNGVRVTEQRLADGDQLTFGNTQMYFQAS